MRRFVGATDATEDRVAVVSELTAAKARSNHTGTQALSTISDAGSIASWDVWVGTQAEYDALGTYQSTTLYLIA